MDRDNEYPAEGQDFYSDGFGERISQGEDETTPSEQTEPLQGETIAGQDPMSVEDPKGFRESLSDETGETDTTSQKIAEGEQSTTTMDDEDRLAL